jgi:hypothetical protein
VEYKTSTEALARLEKIREMLQKKKYHHKLGPGGYKTAATKWEKVKAALIEKGITLAVADWPIRSKQWFYAHGGKLHPETGQIMGPNDEACTNLITKLSKARDGTFNPNRENGELTSALGHPEHQG